MSSCPEAGVKLNRKSILASPLGNTGRSSLNNCLLNLEAINSYKIDYSASLRWPQNATIYMNQLVGAARFELTTPCAQGSFRYLGESTCFQLLTFPALPPDLLSSVESCCLRGLSTATISSTVLRLKLLTE
jgi:hypothetical protein